MMTEVSPTACASAAASADISSENASDLVHEAVGCMRLLGGCGRILHTLNAAALPDLLSMQQPFSCLRLLHCQ
jgi:hypothetical protein